MGIENSVVNGLREAWIWSKFPSCLNIPLSFESCIYFMIESSPMVIILSSLKFISLVVLEISRYRINLWKFFQPCLACSGNNWHLQYISVLAWNQFICLNLWGSESLFSINCLTWINSSFSELFLESFHACIAMPCMSYGWVFECGSLMWLFKDNHVSNVIMCTCRSISVWSTFRILYFEFNIWFNLCA